MLTILNIFDNFWQHITLEPVAIVISFTTILYFIIQKIVEARITHEYDKKLEEYKFEISRREQAVKIAQVFAKRFSKPEYEEINQLIWELSLWLPAEKYRQFCDALKDVDTHDPRQVLINIRQELKTKGELTKDDILHYN